MKILMCSMDAPEPRTNGIRLAVGALLDQLLHRHDVRFVAYRMADQADVPEEAYMQLLEPPTASVRGAELLRATLRRRPWEADRLAAGLVGPLERELARFRPDVVHVNRWLLAGLGRRLRGVGTVLSAFDAWHLNVDASLPLATPLRRPLLRAESRRVQRFERTEFRHFDRVVVVSEEDRAELARLEPGLPLSVVPNGVDTTFYSPVAEAPVAGRIVFTGNMSYPPNIAAAEFLAFEVLPRVRAVEASAHLVVVGRDPHPTVIGLSSLDAVEVTGEVPDVRPFLRSAAVFACPMVNGTGIKNKLLEAMATGVPCVVTPLALQGIDAVPGSETLVGGSGPELSDQIARLIADPGLARRMGAAARRYVCASHSWEAAAAAYEDIYSAVRKPRPTGGRRSAERASNEGTDQPGPEAPDRRST